MEGAYFLRLSERRWHIYRYTYLYTELQLHHYPPQDTPRNNHEKKGDLAWRTASFLLYLLYYSSRSCCCCCCWWGGEWDRWTFCPPPLPCPTTTTATSPPVESIGQDLLPQPSLSPQFKFLFTGLYPWLRSLASGMGALVSLLFTVEKSSLSSHPVL